ncbi:MAG: Multidrug resistance protein MdtA [Steroidobacteraceae bacterium]|nr:Multidrug resistance protein MdtA [Steroidobacteraceae bacterium]
MTRLPGPLPRLLAAAVIHAGLAACNGSPPAAEVEATPVRVAAAYTGPALPAIATNGVVAAKDEMRLSFKLGGIVRRIAVQEGERVRRGQRLAEIELTEVDAQVEQAAQLAAKAQRDLERGERLYADQVISLEQLQDLRTQATVAAAQAAGARFNRSHSMIVAPDDGVVLRRLVEEREFVPAGQTVLVVSGADRGFVVRAALADREIVQVKLGDPAGIRMDAFPGRVLRGTVSEVSRAADGGSGLFPVEVRIEDDGVRFASGLVAKLSIVPAAARTASLTWVPIAAIVEGDGDRASVFVVRDGRALRREVEVAFIAIDGVALAGGLEAGETVVTDGALYLADKDPVTIVKEAAQAAGGTPIPTRG